MSDTSCPREEYFLALDPYVLGLDHARLEDVSSSSKDENKILTRHTGQQLPGKALNLATWKRHKLIPLEKVENALPQQVGDNAYMVPKIEAVA